MKIELPRFSDYHVHFRQPEACGVHVRQSMRYCGRVLAMPNLTPPVVSGHDAACYWTALNEFAAPRSEVLMTVKLVEATTPGVVRGCRDHPQIVAFKLYPAGVTTHSSDGIPAEVIDNPNGHTWFGDVLDDRIPEWLSKPLYDCPPCMASIHGTWVWLITGGELTGLPIFIISLCGLNKLVAHNLLK